jgi:hypothetical protein
MTQLLTISNIMSKMIPATALPTHHCTSARKWFTIDKNILMATEFATYWIITKTTSSSSSYNMYCGSNVPWRNHSFNIPDRLPEMILVIENTELIGILVGGVIRELIDMGISGIFSWLSPIIATTSTASMPAHVWAAASDSSKLDHILSLTQALSSSAPRREPTLVEFMQARPAPAPMAYIQAGNTLIPVPAGGRLDVIPNQFAPMMNISHFRRC